MLDFRNSKYRSSVSKENPASTDLAGKNVTPLTFYTVHMSKRHYFGCIPLNIVKITCPFAKWFWGGRASACPDARMSTQLPADCCGAAVPAALQTCQTISLVGCRAGGLWFFGPRIHWSCKAETKWVTYKTVTAQVSEFTDYDAVGCFILCTIPDKTREQTTSVTCLGFRSQRPGTSVLCGHWNQSATTRGYNWLILILTQLTTPTGFILSTVNIYRILSLH